MTRYADMIYHHTLWCPSYSLTPDGGEVRAINCVSVAYIIISDRAVFEHVETYHCLIFLLGWTCYHTHETTSALCVLDLLFCETFVVLADRVDVDVMIFLDGSYLSKNGHGIWIGLEVNEVEAIG